MSHSIFLTRVAIRNYKSIAQCDVQLHALTWLIGPNGSGKSNFLDALHFVRDALDNSLENALRERGGISEVRRKSYGHPNNFGIRLEFVLPNGTPGRYAFTVGALPNNGYEVKKEECRIGLNANCDYFLVERGEVVDTSAAVFPKTTADRLALLNASGLPEFRPLYDAMISMGFYNLNPKIIREPQKPQDGRSLKSAGENIASVIAHLTKGAPEAIDEISEYLSKVIPSLHGVERKAIGPLETLMFKQEVSGSKSPWEFYAQNMSDGTLRAVGILTALNQVSDHSRPTLIGLEEPETALHPAAASTLREALVKASQRMQVIVTSHSPDLLDDPEIRSDSLVSVVASGGETKLAPVDEASRDVLSKKLFTPGELLRLNQIGPDKKSQGFLNSKQINLFQED
ncbi:AAA family ATPase [Hydrogenophaga palleronii]|uniref:AAA family ATPase n=1 Tax=Hydrogenophaga palleronii TaxID=65655 RepID=UPI000A06B0D1|nr:AAA family ATPase [Hydrogenophaga palleronii]